MQVTQEGAAIQPIQDWYSLPDLAIEWLVDGIIPYNSHCAIVGKPKSGKSTAIRNLIAAVIKSQRFLNRQVNVPKGEGRVLYIHLDSKDKRERVARELRTLGITADECSRLRIATLANLPKKNAGSPGVSSIEDRINWLKQQIAE